MSGEITSMCQIRASQEYKIYDVKSKISQLLGVDLTDFEMDIPCINPVYNDIDRVACSRLSWTPMNDRVSVRWAKFERMVPMETDYPGSPQLQKLVNENPAISFCKEVFTIDGFMLAGPDNFLTTTDHYLSCLTEMDENGKVATIRQSLNRDFETGIPRPAFDAVFSALLTFFKKDCPFFSQYL